jgi:hypothetical protein
MTRNFRSSYPPRSQLTISQFKVHTIYSVRNSDFTYAMPGSPNSPATIVRYGPITREEAIDKVQMERRESSSELRERIDGHPQQRNLAFWMTHVGMIYLWVVESEYRGFFKPEREANQNAVKDQESVLHEQQAVASHNESTNRSPRKHESRAMLKLKWNWLALECMKISRAVLPHFVRINPFSIMIHTDSSGG